MAKWAYVNQDGIVEETHDILPQSSKNISNLYMLEWDKDILNSVGWYQVEDRTQPLPNQITYTYGQPTFTFDANKKIVIQASEIIETADNSNSAEVFRLQRQNFMTYLRTERDKLLAASDYTQLADIQNNPNTTQAMKTAWTTYRQQLRDLPYVYNSGSNATMVNTNEIIWPTINVV